MNFSLVVIGGRLTADPEMRSTKSGTSVCSARVAFNRRVPAGDGKWTEEPVFVDVTVWGKRAEAFVKHHRKGDACFFQGELRLEQWKDKDSGAARQKLTVVAESWEFVGGKKDGAGGAAGGGFAPERERTSPNSPPFDLLGRGRGEEPGEDNPF